jgi:[methyl-Co(III) methanol-specific corrinoid protein]:coenzyme M methyltransferase
MEACGVFWPEAHRDPEKMATLAAQAWEQIGIEGVGVPFCQSVEAEALGCEIHYGDRTQIPSIALSFPGYKTLDEIPVPEDLSEAGRIPAVLEALKILERDYGSEVPILGRMVGPFSAVACLGEMNHVLLTIVQDPARIEEFCEAASGILTAYGNLLLDHGADVVVIEEMIASGDILGRDLFARFSQPYLRKIIQGIRGPTILHICGRGDEMIEGMSQTGATALSIDHKTDGRLAVEKTRGKAAVLGNINAPMTLGMGTPEEVRRETREAVEAGIDLIAPGCMISPITKTENLRAMVEAVKRGK